MLRILLVVMIFIALMSGSALACGQADDCPMHSGNSAEHDCPMHGEEKSDTTDEGGCPMRAEGKCDMPDCDHDRHADKPAGEEI